MILRSVLVFYAVLILMNAVFANTVEKTENSSTTNTTDQDGNIPSRVNFTFSDKITNSSFTINWNNNGSSNTDRYYVMIKNLNLNQEVDGSCKSKYNTNTKELDANTSTYTFTDVEPGYTYMVSIIAGNKVGNSTEILTNVTTLGGPPSPVNITIPDENITSSIFTINWINNGCSNISNYYVTIENLKRNHEVDGSCESKYNINTEVLDANTLTYTFNNAKPDYIYKVSVFAGNEVGNSTETSVNVTTLGEPPSPVNITIPEKNITSSSFTINWINNGCSNISNYYVMIENLEANHEVNEMCKSQYNTTTKVLDANISTYTFTDAEPDYIYKVSVFAGNKMGNSTETSKNVTTLAGQSTEPLNVTAKICLISNNCVVGSTYNSSMDISWSLPCNSNGKLKGYSVEIQGKPSKGNSQGYKNELETKRYNLTFPNLPASYNFTVGIIPLGENGENGTRAEITQNTPAGCPAPPTNMKFSENTDEGFLVTWEEPSEFFGEIKMYNVTIETQKIFDHHHIIHREDPVCQINEKEKYYFHIKDKAQKFQDGLPDFNYTVSVIAQTSAGYGKSIQGEATTLSKESSTIRDLKVDFNNRSRDDIYNVSTLITFEEPCNSNGLFKEYLLSLTGTRNGSEDHWLECKSNTTKIDHSCKITKETLKPAYNYKLNVIVHTQHFNSDSVEENFSSTPGVPAPVNEGAIQINQTGPTQMFIALAKNIFNREAGDIEYYSLILIRGKANSVEGNYYGFWNKSNDSSWPSNTTHIIGSFSEKKQMTPTKWQPFSDNIINITYVFGINKDEECNKTSNTSYCHELAEDEDYILAVRGFTYCTYRDVYLPFRTGKYPSSLGLILGLTFGLTLLIGGILATYFIYRRTGCRFPKLNLQLNVAEPYPEKYLIPVKNFISHYDTLVKDPNSLKAQYELLAEESKIFEDKYGAKTFAVKPENLRKNRYINILPYDSSRVRLQMDEDDEISSDYINASYIKGYSGEIEYITTQGPLQSTCKQFWKMILQEKVSLIVMLSEFIEQKKIKCYKYFPKPHENMIVSEDINVMCLTELNFGNYCVRTLLVEKDLDKFAVIHLQFLVWPDFGCPEGTEGILTFCQEVRERIASNSGLTVVHCSAGVGRSGTLIALDILLQMLNNKKDYISIYDIVLELRRQRTQMVQREQQYTFLHTCVRDALDMPAKYLNRS